MLFALGLAPATTEALPFGIVLVIVGVVVGLPSYRTLKASLAPRVGEAPGTLGPVDASGPPASVACPNCGGPAPLSLAEPGHSTCAHCQHRFALPAALTQQLTEAATLVQQQSQAERHIAKSIQTLAIREQGWLKRMKTISRVLVGLALLVSVYGWFGRRGNDQWHAYFAFGLAATIWVVVLGRIATRIVPQMIRRIVGRWTALQLPGAAGLKCRVCGGPLPEEAAAVLRCGYCSADNLTGPEVLKQLAASAGHAQRGLLAVDQRSQQGDELAAFALLLFPALGLLGWFAAGAFAGSGFLRVGDLPIWIDGGARFVIVRTSRLGGVDPCVAVAVPEGDRVRLVFSFSQLPVVTREALAAALIEEVAPSWFVGKEVEGKGRIASVYRLVRHPTRHLAVTNNEATLYLPADFGVLGGELTCLSGFAVGEGPGIALDGK